MALVEEVQHDGEEQRVREPDGHQGPDESMLKRLVDDVLSFVERRAFPQFLGSRIYFCHWKPLVFFGGGL
jgi:hypothetical protein